MLSSTFRDAEIFRPDLSTVMLKTTEKSELGIDEERGMRIDRCRTLNFFSGAQSSRKNKHIYIYTHTIQAVRSVSYHLSVLSLSCTPFPERHLRQVRCSLPFPLSLILLPIPPSLSMCCVVCCVLCYGIHCVAVYLAVATYFYFVNCTVQCRLPSIIWWGFPTALA